MFAAAVLPVAVYAAEHDRWRPEEIRQLRTAAIASCGANVPGVPHILAALCVPPSLDAAFCLPMAAVERWMREIWLASSPEKWKPDDTLTGDELFKVFRLLTGDDAEQVVRGPGKALAQALEELQVKWDQPTSSKRMAPGGTSPKTRRTS